VLNSSIDVVDISYILSGNDTVAATDQYNQIESITEYIINEATDHKKSLPDQKGGNLGSKFKKTSSLVFSAPVIQKKKRDLDFITISRQPIILNDYLQLPAGFVSIFSPPPNAA
jgi:hypothetical protein